MWVLDNRTPYAADRTWIRDGEGAHRWVVAVKATFTIGDGGRVALSDEQRPVLAAPEHHGEPATSSLRYEAELGPDKPTTDLIVNAVAHPPGGRPVKKLVVGLRVGPVAKDLVVYGTRIYRRGLTGVGPSAPVPFVQRPLVYEWAYGGTDPPRHRCDPRNPAGRGFAVRAVPLGRASALEALRQGCELVVERRCDLCVEGGADSWLDPDALLWLDGQGRLAAAGVRTGFPPGEGAAFLALAGDWARRQRALLWASSPFEVAALLEKHTTDRGRS